MNREDAKQLLPIIIAFAKGKTIEYCNGITDWIELKDNPTFCDPASFYRIKSEPILVPLDFNDRERLRGQWIKEKINNIEFQIVLISENGVYLAWRGEYSWSELFEDWTFLDGSPCGKEQI